MSKKRLEWIRDINKKPSRTPFIFKGNNVLIDESARIGDRGHSMEKDENGNWVRAEHFGDIYIGDNVHIGEFVVVKRATLPFVSTVIGDDTKICAFVNVGHNCKIGKHVFIGPHVLLNGSVEIGDDVYIYGHAVIRNGRKIGDKAIIGMGAIVDKDVPAGATVVGIPARSIKYNDNYIDPSFKHGKNFKIGKYCVIGPNVVVGDDVVLESFIELRPGTRIGHFSYIDSGVKSSGDCQIGNSVTIRYDSIIAHNVIIEDNVFISPHVMFINVPFGEERSDKPTIVRRGVRIGTGAHIHPGVEIAEYVSIGSGCEVVKDCLEEGKVYRASSEIIAKIR